MGWAYARPEIIERLAMFKAEGSSGPFLTQVVARYCAEGRLEAHIEELIALYRHKRDVMLEAIAREFPAEVVTLRPEGGFFVWCKLPPACSATALLPLAEAARGHLPARHALLRQRPGRRRDPAGVQFPAGRANRRRGSRVSARQCERCKDPAG